MLVTDKGQVTSASASAMTPACCRQRGRHSLEAGKIVISKFGSGLTSDRRAKLRTAAAKVRPSMNSEFRQMRAKKVMAFLRPDDPVSTSRKRGKR